MIRSGAFGRPTRKSALTAFETALIGRVTATALSSKGKTTDSDSVN